MNTLIYSISLRRLGLLVVAIMVISHSALCQVTIRSEVNPQSGSMEDLFLFTVVIDGAQEGIKPQLSTNTDFDVQLLGPKTSISIINGTMHSQHAFVYQLSPRKSGPLKTPEAQVLVNGQQLSAPPLTVTIRGDTQDQSPTPDATPRDAIFMNQTASPMKVYVGQQIVNSISVFTRVNLQGVRIEDDTADGFWQEVISDGKNSRKTIRGQEYASVGIERALFPLRAGTLLIPKRTAVAKVPIRRRGSPLSGLDPFSDDFFENFFQRTVVQDKQLSSQELSVEVVPLPAAAPEIASYIRGLPIVGATTVTLEYSDAPIKVGESKSVSVVVTSAGNLNPVKSLPLAAPRGAKVYEGQVQTKHDRNGERLISQKTFSFSVVPLEPGVLRIPGTALAYFDPETHAYKLTTTSDLSVLVTGSAAKPPEAPHTQRTSPSAKVNDGPPPAGLVPTLPPLPFAPALQYEEASLLERITERLSVQFSLLVLSGTLALLFVTWILLRTHAAKAPQRVVVSRISGAATLQEFEDCLREWAITSLPGARPNATFDELRALARAEAKDKTATLSLVTLMDDVEIARYGATKGDLALSDCKRRFLEILKAW